MPEQPSADSDAKWGKVAKTLIWIVSIPLSLLWQAFVMTKLWEWFVVTVFHLPTLTVLQAAGVTLVLRFPFAEAFVSATSPEARKINLDATITNFLRPYLGGAFALLLGYLLHVAQ
jgi:hypothetical protein